MTQRLLTIHNTPKTALVLITLFLLLMPHKAGAENYKTSGDVRSLTNSEFSYGWTDWFIKKTSETVTVRGGKSVLEFDLPSNATITLQGSKPNNATGDFRKVTLDGFSSDLTVSGTFGNTQLITSSEILYLEVPSSWNSEKITITITNPTSNTITCSISSITIQTGTQVNTTFSWGELSSDGFYDISGIIRTGDGNNTTLQGHCEVNAILCMPLSYEDSQTHTIIYSSSNSDVAEVDDNGNITVKAIGQATITATPKESDNTYYLPAQYSYTLNITGIDTYYGLSIHEIRVTSANMNNILNDPQSSVSYNQEDNTLTLKDANITTEDGSDFPGILYDGQEPLNVRLEGSNTMTNSVFRSYSQTPIDLHFVIDTDTPGTLTMTNDKIKVMSPSFEEVSEEFIENFNIHYDNAMFAFYCTQPDNQGGYTSETFTGIYSISVLKPTISSYYSDKRYLTIDNPIAETNVGTIKFSISYADGSEGVENMSFDNNPFVLTKPATISSYVLYGNGKRSATSTAYYFGTDPSPIKLIYGTEAPTFDIKLTPQVNGVSISNVDIMSYFARTVDGTTLITGVGKDKGTAYLSVEDNATFTNLADSIGFTLEVVPASPVFNVEGGTYNTTQTITLTSPYTNPTVSSDAPNADISIKYYLGETAPETPLTYSGPIVISQNTKLTAWVEAKYEFGVVGNDGGSTSQIMEEIIMSEFVSKQYTIVREMGNITIETDGGTEFVYDGTAHTPTILRAYVPAPTDNPDNLIQSIDMTAGTDYDISYTKDNVAIAAENIIDAGTYQMVLTGKGNFTGTKEITFTIAKADITPTVSLEGWIFGNTPNEPQVDGNTGNGAVSYTYQAAGSETFTTEIPTAIGTHTVKATIAATTNYNAAEATAQFTIAVAAMTVTATGYTGTYDAQPHGISVTAPEGATVKYGTEKGTYELSASPTFTDAGSYMVHYQITQENYITIADSAKVEIAKADITPTVSLEGWIFGNTPNEPQVEGNTGGGAVSYTYQAAGSETFSTEIPTAIGTHTVKATIAETTNYNAAEATAQFTIAVAAMTVTATGYTGTYDAQPHGISVTAPEGATVKYGTEKGTYELSASPTYTDAGSYMVHYQITQENYITIADSAKVEIAKADITPTVSLEGWIFGNTPNEPQVEGNTGNGAVSYTYQAAGSETFTTEIPTAIGTHTVKATIAATTNYNAAEATAQFTIAVAAMTVTATGYTGTYDAQPHGISVTAPEGATVKYGTEKGTYELSTSPTFTDAGSYMVHYQITQENYITIADSAKVEIAKADITPTVSLEGWIFGATPNEPQVEGNTGNGAVSYTYQAAGSETFSTEIPTAIGTHTVKATIAATTNYNSAEATAQFTIAVAAMTVTAAGYTGTYDAQPHGISVTAPEGATVKYGTEKGTYELSTSPTFTDAGLYMVHYQITQENYITIADSAKVEIAKADITPTVSLEGWIFGATPNEPQVEGNTGNGAVSYTYQAAGSETFTTEIPIAIGTHTVKATIAATTNYNAAEATAQFTIDGGYLLWIGGTLVTDANKTDILGDAGNNEQSIPSFTFNPDNNCLVIINSTEGLVIESQRPLLKIHLNGTNTLRRISFNNGGNSQNTGQLLFTCESSNPGSVTIENTEAESCISGFESVAYEFNLCVLDPEGTNYKDGKIVNTDGTPASKVSISVPLTPMTGEEPERLNPEEFTTTNDEGETVAKSMDNTVAGNVLYTINEQVDGQGYDQETNSIVVIQTMTDDEVQKIVEAAKSNTITVGTDEYAEQYNGLTFVVPGGTGVIKIVQETAAGYEFRLKIGDDESLTLGEGQGGLLSSEIPYDLEDATYCWLYLAQSRAATRRAAWERVGKRNKGLGNIQTVKVSPSKMASSNSASTASGGVITQTISEVTTGVVEADAGISKTAEATSQRWYTIDGRRIDQPTKKGIYIRNNKKVVIK